MASKIVPNSILPSQPINTSATTAPNAPGTAAGATRPASTTETSGAPGTDGDTLVNSGADGVDTQDVTQGTSALAALMAQANKDQSVTKTDLGEFGDTLTSLGFNLKSLKSKTSGSTAEMLLSDLQGIAAGTSDAGSARSNKAWETWMEDLQGIIESAATATETAPAAPVDPADALGDPTTPEYSEAIRSAASDDAGDEAIATALEKEADPVAYASQGYADALTSNDPKAIGTAMRIVSQAVTMASSDDEADVAQLAEAMKTALDAVNEAQPASNAAAAKAASAVLADILSQVDSTTEDSTAVDAAMQKGIVAGGRDGSNDAAMTTTLKAQTDPVAYANTVYSKALTTNDPAEIGQAMRLQSLAVAQANPTLDDDKLAALLKENIETANAALADSHAEATKAAAAALQTLLGAVIQSTDPSEPAYAEALLSAAEANENDAALSGMLAGEKEPVTLANDMYARALVAKEPSTIGQALRLQVFAMKLEHPEATADALLQLLRDNLNTQNAKQPEQSRAAAAVVTDLLPSLLPDA